MSNKIKIQADYGDDNYQPSSSEDDYTEDEKRLLQKFRKRNQRKTNGQQEIMNLKPDESDDDDDEEDEDDFANFEANSDMEDADADDGIPDARAWGNKRGNYYSADFDGEFGKYGGREEEIAEQEEAEARAIQLRLAKNLEEADFSLNTFVTDLEKTKKSKKEKDTEIYLKKDLSELTERQKEQLFEKESPEFSNLVKDMNERLTESSELLEPVLRFLESKAIQSPLVDFVKLRHHINLNYATNVSFYLVLKSKRVSIKNHPVIKRLVQLRQLLLQLKHKYVQTVKPQLTEILECIKQGEDITLNSDSAKVVNEKRQVKLRKKLDFLTPFEAGCGDEEDVQMETEGEDGEPLALGQIASDEEENEQAKDEDEKGDERRAITYQIAKNKGLTPYRKKELRNPRVKHRNKFRKALIRRKGAVRTFRKEIKRYDGEKFGIKTTVKKGIKIK